MQVKLEANVAKSAKYYGINLNLISSNDDGETEDGNEADVEGEGLDADLATGNKDTCVLEVIQNSFLISKLTFQDMPLSKVALLRSIVMIG